MSEQDWGLDPLEVGGGGGNVGYDLGDEVLSNGFTGVISKDEGIYY